MNNYKPSEDEIDAGIETLGEFPPFITTIKPMMARYGQPIEYFLDGWDSETLFMILLHDYVENTVQKNLAAIKKINDSFETTK